MLGKPDNFHDDYYNREYAPRSAKLQTCTSFDWRNVNGYYGDIQPAQLNYFDNSWTNSPLVVTFSNIPTGVTLQNARLDFSIRVLDSSYSYNDGIGILFDDAISARWGWEDDDDAQTQKVCKVQYFAPFTALPGGSGYGRWYGQVLNITWYLNSTTLSGSSVRIIDKIAQTGSFNVMWGDDTGVDYASFSYEIGSTTALNVTTYSCRPYTTANALGVGKVIYTDKTLCKVNNLTDSSQYPFSGAQFLQTHSADAGKTESCFHHRIDSATRYWLFVPKELNLSWVNAGQWQPLESSCGITSSEGQTYKVFTKRYEGGRNVVFGPSCSSTTQGKPMYFVATAPAVATAAAPVNPSANCLCSSTGDPHYVTFDSRKYDFWQPGVYHLVKARDCSFDVQTLTFKYGSSVTVNGIVGVRYFTDTVVLARQNATSGQLWTGYPKVYVNGVFVNASTTVGGIVVTKVSSSEWKISITERNFTLRAVEATSWFHIYASLGDQMYQRTVDGLCGNCDANGKNDFKYPNCDTAIDNPSDSITASQAATWGVSWAVPDGGSFTGTDKNTKSLGAAAYSYCQANPIQQICPDLILTQPGNGVEPSPPPWFYACNGTTIIPTANMTVPKNVSNVTDVEPCSSNPNYANIRARCNECFNLTGYNPEHCLVDLCYGPDSPSSYVCPIPDNFDCPVGIVNSTVSYAGYTWASLGDGGGAPHGIGEGNCLTPFSLPSGWEIAPEGDVSKTVILSYTWASSCMVVQTGMSYPTAQVVGGEHPCLSAAMVQTGRCYVPNRCEYRIIIRKPEVDSCGNGILAGSEECDDGNLQAGDGCSSSCTKEDGYDCYKEGSGSKCYKVQKDDVVIDEPTFTCNMPTDICKPCPYSADLATSKTCCVCTTPCCD